MKRIAFAAIILATSPANALDFSQQILGPDSKPFEMCADAGKHEACAPMTLASVVTAALFNDLPSDHDPQNRTSLLSGEQKAKNAALGLRILAAKGEDVKLSVEEIANLKARVGAAYPPLTVLRAFVLLDPNSKF